MVLVLLSLASSVWAGKHLDVHDGSEIIITSPQYSKTVRNWFHFEHSLKKGTMGDHVYVFLDGTYQEGCKGHFNDISFERHTITVKVVTHDHDMVSVSNMIEVLVK